MMDAVQSKKAIDEGHKSAPNYLFTLKSKALILITLAVVSACSLLSVMYLNIFMVEMRDELQKRGDTTVQHLAVDSYYPLLTEDTVLLEQLIKVRIAQPDVAYVVIRDNQGNILKSSREYPVSDKKPEIFPQTLADSYPGLLPLMLLNKTDYFEFSTTVWQNNRETTDPVGDDISDILVTEDDLLLKPIANMVNHRDNVKLGSVHVGFSMSSLHRMLQKLIWTGIVSSLAGAIIIIALSFIIIHRKISTISLVASVARQIAENQGRKVLIPTAEFKKHQPTNELARDEVGDLFSSFENMLEQLNNYHHFMQTNAAELQRANNAKSDFISTVSHEFRTPLNAIIGYCELIMLDHQDGRVPEIEDTKKINHSATHLLDLINEVLNISKLEAGKVDLNWEEIDVPRIIDDAVVMCRGLATENNNQLTVSISPDVTTIRMDRTKLSQCLINLIGNACKFTMNGIVTVSCEIGAQNRIYFTVKDTGIGIAKEKLEHVVFEPFSQADNSITRKYGGTGLGLTVTRKLIKILGGDISVESEIDVGTTFTFWLNLNHRTISFKKRTNPDTAD